MSDQIARPRTDAVPHLIALRPFDPADVETLQRIERSAHQRYATLEGFEGAVYAGTYDGRRSCARGTAPCATSPHDQPMLYSPDRPRVNLLVTNSSR